jgi:kynurenine formamidase
MNPLANFLMIDLTHTLQPEMPAWDMNCNFHITQLFSYQQHGFAGHAMQLPCGIGTHIDAPYHFADHALAIDELPLQQLIAPAIVIDWPATDSRAQFGLADLQNFETTFGRIPSNSIVLFNTHWSNFWHDAKAYRNEDAQGRMHYPTIHVDVARALAERQVLGIGIDTLSPDPDDDHYPLHHFWLAQNKIIIENLTNLHLLPVQGALLCAFPMKIKGATEAPARVIAIISHPL